MQRTCSAIDVPVLQPCLLQLTPKLDQAEIAVVRSGKLARLGSGGTLF